MSPLCLLFLLILPSYALLPKGTTRHELTFDLEQRLTCFFEEFSKNDRLRVSVVSMEDKKLLLQLRVTSPSGSQSDWTSGDRSASQAWQNLTESGIYEICVHSNAETRVSLNIFAYNEEQLIAGVSAYNDTNLQVEIAMRVNTTKPVRA